jgi:hypothetical protein
LLLFELVKKASFKMKKSALKFLPVMAILFAVSMAFAAQPAPFVGTLKAFKSPTPGAPRAWIQIPENQTYSCDEVQSANCVARFLPNGSMEAGTLIHGNYSE